MCDQVLSKRGKEKFTHDGFAYVFDKNSTKDDSLKFWRCEERGRCKARIHVKDGQVLKTVNSHTHDPSAVNIEVQRFTTKLKNRAETTVEVTNQIITECLLGLTQAGQGSIPNKSARRKVVQRKRDEVEAVPANPGCLRDLHIPHSFRVYQTEGGVDDEFVLSDLDEDNKVIILGRRTWLQHLRSEIWYADGTFKIAPPLFSQVYVISTTKLGGVIPVIYALLPNKQRATYTKLFALLKEIDPQLAPAAINCDFEQAAIAAMEENFPRTQIYGCFFHLSQNLQKHLAEIGLMQMYRNDPDFELQAKMVC